MEHVIIWKIAGSGAGSSRNTVEELAADGQEDINPPLKLFTVFERHFKS